MNIKVVENADELMKAFLVRAIVYMHEQDCPYEEEFDLNDYSATQIVGLIGPEPVLTARIRYVGRAAKLERLAVRDKYRGAGYGHKLLKFLIMFCQKKGLNRLYLHAQARLQPFYESYGFRRVRDDFNFSDHAYVEMVVDLPARLDALSLDDAPLVINRPEGRLDQPGPMEASLDRIPAKIMAAEGV